MNFHLAGQLPTAFNVCRTEAESSTTSTRIFRLGTKLMQKTGTGSPGI
jgi:hypothetical protein